MTKDIKKSYILRKYDGVKQVKRFISKIVLVALAASLVMPVEAYSYNGFGTKTSAKKEDLAEGVSLVRESYSGSGRNQAVQVLDVQYRNPNVGLELYYPTPIGRVETTSQQAMANTYENHRVVGAVNASFYNMSNGMPVNLLVENNKILNYGVLSNDQGGPVNAPFAFGVNRNGALTLTDFQTKATFYVNGQTYDLGSINGARGEREAVLYTSGYKEATTGASQWVTDIVVTNTNKSAANFSFGDKITGTVSEIRRLGEGANATIPKDGFVISANGGPFRDALAGVSVGDELTVEASINDAWRDAEFILATGPTLVRNGQTSISMSTSSPFARERAPRTAVGASSDGTKLFLVTIDGRQSGYSNGVTIPELAAYMRSIGAHNAINLDGGGSTTMVARYPWADHVSVVNRPSDPGGRQRAVPTTLQVISKAAPIEITEDALVVNDFDSTTGLSASAARATASIARATSYEPIRMGQSSVRLNYDYTQGESGTSAAYVKFDQAKTLLGNPKQIGMWAYGDGREHWLRATLLDGQGNRHTVDFTQENRFNWRGWQHVRANIPEGLTAPIRIEQVYIAQPTISKQGNGRVYFDHLEAIYNPSYEVQRFSDVNSTFWGRGAILNLSNEGIISGFDNGTFRPNEPITRAQTASMIARALGLTSNGSQTSLTDIDPSSTYYSTILAVEQAGVMTGKTATRFDPNATLTRAEMAAILQRAYKLSGTSTSPFPDVPKTHWAYGAIDTLKANNISSGMPNGNYGPNQATTRAEFSVFLDRVNN
jgi:exopolysaccharide biosynthesis protein